MKTITRSNVYLPMAAMILTAALAVPAAAQKQVPFKGTMQGQDADSDITLTSVKVTTKGTGIATQLGQFSFVLINIVTFATGTSAGTATFTAANGDSFSTTVTGSGEFIAPDLISIMETYTITGGTGRFAGAQGTFIVERLASPVTFMTSGSFLGSITSPGAAK
jgi:hypothetical protein